MNIDLVKTTAIQLKQLLQLRSSTDSVASSMLEILAPTLDAAIAGQITKPYPKVSSVPYSYQFSDGELQDKPDIANAYAHFVTALRGKSSLYSQKADV